MYKDDKKGDVPSEREPELRELESLSCLVWVPSSVPSELQRWYSMAISRASVSFPAAEMSSEIWESSCWKGENVGARW